MSTTRSNRSVSALLLAASLTALGASPAMAQVAPQSTADVEKTFLSAAEMLEQNRPVAARRLMMRAFEAGGANLSDADREHAFKLMVSIRQAEQALGPAELSLQHAEMALESGDLVLAERQATAVLDSQSHDGAQLIRAERVLEGVARKRVELEPRVGPSLHLAVQDLRVGDLPQAKERIGWIARSGVRLSNEQNVELGNLQLQIVAAESGIGSPTVTLAAQPATDDPDAGAQPDAQPDPIQEANREEVNRLFDQASTMRSNRQYNDARQVLLQVQNQYGASLTETQRQRLNSELNALNVLLEEPTVEGGGLDPVIDQRETQRQETQAIYRNLLAQSDRAFAQGDTAGARELALQARAEIEGKQGLFTAAAVEQMLAVVEARLTEIDEREEQIRTQETRDQALAEQIRQREEARNRENERRRRIREAIVRVRELQLDRKYREALQVLDQQVLFLDPNDPVGLLLKEIIHDTVIFMEFQQLRSETKHNFSELVIQNRRAAVPPLGIMNFPKDWPQLSYLRSPAGQYAESPENRAVLATIQDKRLPNVEFAGNTLSEVLGFVEQVSLVNVDVDWGALESINIGRDETINLSLRNVPVETVLNRVLEKVSADEFGEQASWAIQDGVLVISSDEQIRKNTILDIYDVRDLVVEVPDYTDAPTFDLNTILQSSRGGGGGQSPFQGANSEDDWQQTPLEDRLDIMKNIIRDTIDAEGWRINGGDTGFIQDWQGQLIVTNTPTNHRQIRGLLGQLRDVRAMQINVESRFMLVSQDFFEQIGFDLDVVLNADNNQITAARGNDPTILPIDFFQNGRLVRQVTGFETPSDSGDTVTQGTIPPNRGFSPVGVLQDSLGLAGALIPSEGIASQILGRAPALGIAGTFLDDVQVDFLLQATQADRRSISLTAPRLTFTNGQTSNIYVVTQVGFVSDLTPIVSDSAVGFDPQIDVVSEGVRMIVDGVISADRRFVTMNIDAALAQIEGFENEIVTAQAGGQLVPSSQTNAFIQVPTTTVTRVQTTVTVPDQGTILLGGQRLVSEFEVESGVPVLSKIPVLNRFFTNRVSTKEEQTLMILLKPTVLIQSEQEETQFPGLVDTLGSSFGG